MIYKKMEILSQKLSQSQASNGIVELRKTYLAMTTDSLGGHAFNKSADLLREDQKAEEWRKTIKAVAILTPLAKQFTWLIPLVLKVPIAVLQAIVPDLSRIAALHRVSARLHQSLTQRVIIGTKDIL